MMINIHVKKCIFLRLALFFPILIQENHLGHLWYGLRPVHQYYAGLGPICK